MTNENDCGNNILALMIFSIFALHYSSLIFRAILNWILSHLRSWLWWLFQLAKIFQHSLTTSKQKMTMITSCCPYFVIFTVMILKQVWSCWHYSKWGILWYNNMSASLDSKWKRSPSVMGYLHSVEQRFPTWAYTYLGPPALSSNLIHYCTVTHYSIRWTSTFDS